MLILSVIFFNKNKKDYLLMDELGGELLMVKGTLDQQPKDLRDT